MMTAFAPILQAFFTDYLQGQLRASEHTVAAYRDTFRLLLTFTTDWTGKRPSALDMADLKAPLIIGFLTHLETDRGNSVSTRNARLGAVHSLFGYAATRMPEHAGLIAQVLAIPPKRTNRPTVSYLTATEVRALLAAPDQSTRIGRRDHALLQVATQTGLRVSELTTLRCQDAWLGIGAYVRCDGKGRKQRCTPLTTATAKALRAWVTERAGEPLEPLFCRWDGHPLSRDAVERLLRKNVAIAAETCPSLREKKVSPHVLRHSAAMALLHAGVDLSVIALWLGHETTRTVQAYLHADMTIKQRALDRAAPPGCPTGRYHPPDVLIAFLDGL
jgi:site-specific recombinase XerD